MALPLIGLTEQLSPAQPACMQACLHSLGGRCLTRACGCLLGNDAASSMGMPGSRSCTAGSRRWRWWWWTPHPARPCTPRSSGGRRHPRCAGLGGSGRCSVSRRGGSAPPRLAAGRRPSHCTFPPPPAGYTSTKLTCSSSCTMGARTPALCCPTRGMPSSRPTPGQNLQCSSC